LRSVHPCAEVRREICVCDLSSPAVVGLSPNGGPVFRRNTVLFSSRVVDRAMSVGLRALLRSPCRDHPHAPSIYLVCDRRFLSVAESDVKNCRTSSYLAGRGALGHIARIVSSSSL
jgi:hypothetical protein